MATRESVRDMSSKFAKLDRSQGQDFRRWKNMHFLLTTLKALYLMCTGTRICKGFMGCVEGKIHGRGLVYSLRIEESLRSQETDKGKGKFEENKSTVNMVETENKPKKFNKSQKGKRKFKGNDHCSNKKGKMVCWNCGKPRHIKHDCRVKVNSGSKAADVHCDRPPFAAMLSSAATHRPPPPSTVADRRSS
ncbi:hypothetical protein E3N88_34676 [Mikania micrantha]|uniref:CCHC-type domain-containing protein n=1 Tax=Mikania micrantha TaxID=192012 RepID=A0A5N6LZN8_9ASTR|nr:hypothetical protein E3N88_34676 [Mikania micrantha]